MADKHPTISTQQQIPGWFGPGLIATAAAIMLFVSWRKWPDLLIDFGQQLYLAWQMSEGRTLYEELICNYGPLAPYANAWAFEWFGASVMTLAGLNLGVFLGIAFFTYRLLLRIGTPFSAMIGGLLLMLVFGFSQLSQTGNYNYATPYENSLTIGLLPALAALWLALRHLDGKPRVLPVGLCLGIAFLSKPEVFLAGAGGVGAAWICAWWIQCWEPARIRRTLGVTLLGIMIPIIVASVLLATAMDFQTAVWGTLGSWPAMFGSGAADLLFYQRGMGLDDLGSSLNKIGVTAGLWLLVVALAVGGGLGVAKLPAAWRWPAAILATALVTAAGIMSFTTLDWHRAPRPLQFILLLVIAIAASRLAAIRRTHSSASDTAIPQIAGLAYASFAGILLLKMIFNVRIYHYGFVLAMPAAMVASTALVAWIPHWIRDRSGHGPTSAGIGLAMLIGFSQSQLRVSKFELDLKKTAVGVGANRILADDRAHFVKLALARIRELKPKTMAVFPEGSIFNFLSQIPNPTPFYNFVPTGYAIFGEDRILGSLRSQPPDVLVMIEKDTSEFGYRYFGVDYAQATQKWIDQTYVRDQLFGNEPLRDKRFGIRIWRRRQ
jgi:hypothetical protein